MRFCHNCSSFFDLCKIDFDSNKCIECVRKKRFCNLIFLNIVRWRRLKKQRKKFKTELKKAYAKQQRLFRQINHLKKKQRMIIKNELSNIVELKQKKAAFFALPPALDPLIDVSFEAIVLSENWKNWRLSFFVSAGSLLKGAFHLMRYFWPFCASILSTSYSSSFSYWKWNVFCIGVFGSADSNNETWKIKCILMFKSRFNS